MALILIDKSAYVRGIAERFSDGDVLCLCSMVRLEILFSAQSFEQYAAYTDELARFRDLRMSAGTFAAAEAAQHALARTGEHRIPLPDLLIAACAQQYGADVLHHDRHFDLLAERFGFRSLRV